MLKVHLGAVAIAALAGIYPTQSYAAGYPEKDITFIIPYGPGGGFDTIVRRMAPLLEKALPNKVNVIPTNMPGGSGKKGATFLSKSKPDGYTIMIFNMPGHGLSDILGTKTSYDINTFTWLNRVGRDGYVVVTGAKSPIKSMKDIMALKRPIKVPDQGPGSTSNLANKIVWHSLGVTAQFISGYKGSRDYATAVMRGDGDVTMLATGTGKRFNAKGDFKILANFEDPVDPELKGAVNGKLLGKPDLDQLGLDRIIGGPAGMPADVVKILSDALFKAASDPNLKKWGQDTDNPIAPLNAADAAKTVQQSLAYYKKFKAILK